MDTVDAQSVDIKDLQTTLLASGFKTVAADLISKLIQHEGLQFVHAVKSIDAIIGPSDDIREYLTSTISAVTPTTRRVIELVSGNSSFLDEDLLEISKAEGRAFRTAIRAVAHDPKREIDQADYLRKSLLGHLGMTPSAERQEIAHKRTEDREQTFQIKPSVKQPLDEKNYRTVHLYAKQAAVCIAEDITRRTSIPTLRFEVAKASNEGVYDWSNKQSLQSTPGELALILGVFQGKLKRADISGHGVSNEKSMYVEMQDSKLYLAFRFGRGPGFGIPIGPSDVFQPMALIHSRLKAAAFGGSDSVVDSFVEAACSMYKRQVGTNNK